MLGWVLHAVVANEDLSRWVFKGGTCLKKCFFETYRFSEDLDFTVPQNVPLSVESLAASLLLVVEWIEARTGLRFPRDGIKVEQYDNPRGNTSYQAKLTYAGPLKMARASRQRIKFDITSDEVVASEPMLRLVHHPYSDDTDEPSRVLTYSLEEVVAEKTRALFERGRARDVYDVVHLHRTFSEEFDADEARRCLAEKFAFKGIGEPSRERILAELDEATLRANWEKQLAHQLPALPPFDAFLGELPDALAWIDPNAPARVLLPSVTNKDVLEAAPRFPSAFAYGKEGLLLESIRFAARNRVCARIRYHGHERIVEPYSLRRPRTGNLLLYGFERLKAGSRVEAVRAYKLDEIQSASATDILFAPRWRIEL